MPPSPEGSPPALLSATHRPGDRLGPYVLRRVLGSGGSAEVWEALLEGPGGFQKPVALKVLKTTYQRETRRREAFLREARLGARLQHPNLVGTLLVSEVEGRTCVALELVPGCTVAALQRKLRAPMPPAAVLEVGMQVAEALHYIHTFEVDGRPAGIVHRDVKPSNLLLDLRGQVKLADLGISVGLGEVGAFAGTPGYAAPEQVSGRPEPRSDLFALGVTLFSLASGRPLFGRRTQALEGSRRTEELLRQPGFLAPADAALPGLGWILRSCLRFDPADRPESAEALRQALASLRPSVDRGPALRRLVAREEDPPTTVAFTSSANESTARAPAGNVPPGRDSFVGRQDELSWLQSEVSASRWVVVLGPGGLGKTRLALELARAVQGRFAGGAWLFDLTAARTEEGVCGAVAQELGIPLQSSDPAAQVGHALAALGPCLVVVDNLEQCVTALPGTVERWRTLAPQVRFVGTSRVRPGLPGEAVLALGSLEATDALRLFEQRSPRPLRTEERGEVGALCVALEGVPLAVELAAARLRVLGVGEVTRRLSMRLLGGGGAERPERHRSLETSLWWSWELLTEAGRRALSQVSVFEGGFDWSAAEAVLDLGPGGPWALDVLQELVDASLVRVDASSGRLSTWVVVGEFARDRLQADPAAAAAVEARHGRHYACLGADGEELAREIDNLVSACRRAAARGDAAVALRALERAGQVFALQGPYPSWVALAAAVRSMALSPAQEVAARVEVAASLLTQGRQSEIGTLLAETLRRLDALDPADRAEVPAAVEIRLLASLGPLRIRQGRLEEAAELVTRWLRRCAEAGDRAGEGTAHAFVGELQMTRGQAREAEASYHQALRAHREQGRRRDEGLVRRQLGGLALRQSQPEEAAAHFLAALELHRAVGDRRYEGVTLGNLGAVQHALGRFDDAAEHYARALRIHRAVGNRRSEGATLGNLGTVLREQGRTDEAAEHYVQAIRIHLEIEDRVSESIARANLAELRRRQTRLAEALDEARQAREGMRGHERRLEAGVLCVLGDVQTDLGRWQDARATFEEGIRLAQGSAMPAEHATLVASRARCEAMAGDAASAARLLEEARGLAGPLRPSATSDLGRALAAAAGALRWLLGGS